MKLIRIFITCAGLISLVLLAPPASAELMITAQPSAATAGGNGFFDVTLTNPDTNVNYNVATFEFELTAPSGSGITFTNVNMNTTDQYLFSGASLDGGSGMSSNSFPNTEFIASDSSANNNGYVTVSSGNSFGLGRVYYAASSTASGPIVISFTSSGTSLTDVNGNTISDGTNNGTITVASAPSAPEPSEAGMLCMIGLGLGGLMLRARKRAR